MGARHLASLAGRRGSEDCAQSRPRCRGRTASVALFCGLAGFFLVEHLSIPLPMSDMRIPAAYDSIDAELGEHTVLELPLGWRNGARVLGLQDEMIMFVQWYQTSHGQRLLGGNTSRNPAFKFQYFARAPVRSSTSFSG